MANVHHLFDPATSTLTYVVYDGKTRDCVVIDPVLDFDPPSGKITAQSFEKLATFIDSERLKPHFVFETHAHADHLSSSQLLKRRYPDLKIAIGQRICEVQKAFKSIFNLPDAFATDGRQFDRLLKDDETVPAGSLNIRVIPTPGHTVACCCLLIEDMLFTGDALFMPDSGTGRCDFPGGSATTLYQSITRRVYSLPDQTRTFTGHDYQPNGRELQFASTVGTHKTQNIHLKSDTTEDAYVGFRTSRDKTLSAPKLLLPSIQINIDAGHLPPKASNGVRYLVLPLQTDLNL